MSLTIHEFLLYRSKLKKICYHFHANRYNTDRGRVAPQNTVTVKLCLYNPSGYNLTLLLKTSLYKKCQVLHLSFLKIEARHDSVVKCPHKRYDKLMRCQAAKPDS